MARALIAAPASRSASQSGSSLTTWARLALMVLVALPRLRRFWASASPIRAAAGNPMLIRLPPGARPGASSVTGGARANARKQPPRGEGRFEFFDSSMAVAMLRRRDRSDERAGAAYRKPVALAP
jgi:hypothetical protein